MSNYVNYQVELCESNADLINSINVLLGVAVVEQTPNTDAEKQPPKKTVKKKAPAEKKQADNDVPTAAAFKDACKAAKKDHGEEFTMKVMADAGVKVTAKLGTSLSKVDEDDYVEIMESWVAGPSDDDGLDDDDDDGLDDDDDDAEVEVDAVVAALKAYSKDTGKTEAREIMKANGASRLSEVADCTQAQLAAMLKATV